MRYSTCLRAPLKYCQGQYRGKIREYFYYVDHHGMLFLEDAKIKNFTSCFKERKFLTFFFKRLKVNNGEYKDEFPYVSPCGIELNFVKVDDLPIVFTKLSGEDVADAMLEVNGSDISFPFNPADMFMKESNGRVYHAGPDRLNGVGLISSKLAIHLSSRFVAKNDEYKYFTWANEKVNLSNICRERLDKAEGTTSH